MSRKSFELVKVTIDAISLAAFNEAGREVRIVLDGVEAVDCIDGVAALDRVEALVFGVDLFDRVAVGDFCGSAFDLDDLGDAGRRFHINFSGKQ